MNYREKRMITFRQDLCKLVLLAALVSVGACTYGRIGAGNGHYTQAAAIKGQGGTYKIGNPYKIMGKWYYPKEDYSYSEVGMASWYGKDFHAKKTANGENYDMHALTAAHRTLPLPSIVRVTNLENGRSLVLRVNDRGPYAKDRIIDISKRGAQLLGYQTQGVAKVRVEILPEESKALKAALLGEEYDGPTSATSAVQTASVSKATGAPTKPLELKGAGYLGTGAISYPKNSWFVQAGAYSKQSSAQDLSRKLDKYGATNVYYVTVNGRQLYRVRMGPYSHRQEAEVALARVKHYGVYDAKVVQD